MASDRWLLTTMLCYPAVLLVTFIISAATYSIRSSKSEEELMESTATGPGGKPLPATKRRKRTQHNPVFEIYIGVWAQRVFQYITAAVVLTFVADCAAVIAHAMDDQAPAWWCGEEKVVYIVGGFSFHLYVLLTLVQWSNAPNVAHCAVWLLALLGEAVILATQTIQDLSRHRVIRHIKLREGDDVPGLDTYDHIDIIIAATRFVLIASLIFLYVAIAAKRYRKNRYVLAEEGRQSDSDEASPLLGGQHHPGYQTQGDNGSDHSRSRASSHHASIPGNKDAGHEQQEDEAAFYRSDKLPHKNWWEYCRGYSVFFPYLWPSKSLRLQGVVLVCVILVGFQRAVNVMVPLQYGKVTDLLSEENEFGHHMPWAQISLLILYKFLQGNSGLIGSIRAILWVPVSQHTYRALTTAAFEHVHSLSLDFHLGKRTGEVLSALNKGASINTFLEQVTFFVLPMVFDLFVAIVFFYYQFGSVYALAVSIITFYYLYVSIQMAQTRVDQRRDMVNADREEEAVKNDSITSYETVKYFNAEKREFQRYREAIKTYQEAEAKVTYGIQHMNMAQTAVFMTGIFSILMICAYEVAHGTRKVGVFVSLMSYLNQLQGPLNFFGSFYRTIQQAMVSGERLLELFKIQPSVVDRPGVEDLKKCEGQIRWKGVKFSYDRRRPALRDLSFECAPGTTTAFVGESGGGKSTVFRLMFRYYNCEQGSIEIDGHDVKDVTIDSVRRYIGVVPQDTILFNETLMYNLQYANPDATEEDVFEACRAAAIHDRIIGFPDGYNTKVGERGLRLSGGEKQRVAIARTILKKPKIIMLDEATSALDGETEQKIQSKLISGNLGQDRTLLIIAHRLSTITHADQIIVLHNGTIAERGTHEELLALGGRYASMWDKHCRAERAVHEARLASKKANKLLAQANLSVPRPTGLHADDPSDGYASMASSTVLHTGPNTPRGEHAGSSSGSDAGSDTGSRRGSHAGSDVTAASSQRDDESISGTFHLEETEGEASSDRGQPTTTLEQGQGAAATGIPHEQHAAT
ncbi:hypothetical protein CONLIGDRAFT_569741 [Coniochaeta ligniaria NRRL 30616]|uniref:Heavy metal tolerance protein n=1 Tax=Coniochaeta ligniaria NRRL 30616 TaxID=1408157 RepID=A0A1J7JU29_9PEZI|nr:hypothetical protein CONLIGDRAFT_569741 [Coniochaeta ligniaria NRRL 30616]